MRCVGIDAILYATHCFFSRFRCCGNVFQQLEVHQRRLPCCHGNVLSEAPPSRWAHCSFHATCHNIRTFQRFRRPRQIVSVFGPRSPLSGFLYLIHVYQEDRSSVRSASRTVQKSRIKLASHSLATSELHQQPSRHHFLTLEKPSSYYRNQIFKLQSSGLRHLGNGFYQCKSRLWTANRRLRPPTFDRRFPTHDSRLSTNC
jgi:hypothetical protein